MCLLRTLVSLLLMSDNPAQANLASTPTIRRLLVCTLAAPTLASPLFGIWNIEQAKAMRELGVRVQLLKPVFRVPRWIAALSTRARRHAMSAESYEIDGIPVRSPRTLFAAPRMLRVTGAELLPQVVGTYAQLTLTRALAAAVDQFQPDAVLAHSVVTWATAIERVLVPRRVAHAYIEHSQDEVMRVRPGSALANLICRGAGHSSAVFVVGEQMRQHLAERVGCPGVRFVANGVTPLPDAKPHQRRPDELQRQLVVLSAGHYYPKRGFELLVDAFSRVAVDDDRAHLYLVTEPPASLLAQIATSPVSARIHLLGTLPHTQLLQWMAWSDLFALPSYREAFGIVYGEALSAGVPVIMSTDCGFRALLQPVHDHEDSARHNFGWVVKPNDLDSLTSALRDAFQRPDLREAMGHAGQRFVRESLTWKANASAIIDVLSRPPVDGSAPATASAAAVR